MALTYPIFYELQKKTLNSTYLQLLNSPFHFSWDLYLFDTYTILYPTPGPCSSEASIVYYRAVIETLAGFVL